MAKSEVRPITGRIELYTWRDFTKAMKIMEAGKWIFRGQEDADWLLESGLDRYLKDFDKAGSRNKEGSRDSSFLSAFPRAEYFAISRFRAMSREHEDWGSNINALGMFLVTETGVPDEPLLGIITAWDLASASAMKARSPNRGA